MKYKLTDETIITPRGVTLHRVQALKGFSDVERGDLGGWVQSTDNLSQAGDCWVYGDARVFGRARVYGDARVFGRALVLSDARVYGDAWVFNNALVYGDAWVYGDSRVSKTPKTIDGLRWHVTMTDDYLIIGCQCHTPAQWDAFTDDEIATMDDGALEFWKEHKTRIMELTV